MNEEFKYYIVTVTSKEQVGEDKFKKTSKKFVVKAVNMTDVEAKIAEEYSGLTLEYSIKTIADQNIETVIL